MITKAEQIAGRDGEIHSESWLQIQNRRPHMARVSLARAHIWEGWCFYAESFELKNAYRGLQISWGTGGAGGSEAGGLPSKVP